MLTISTSCRVRLAKKLLPIGATLAFLAAVGCGGGTKEDTGSGTNDLILVPPSPSDPPSDTPDKILDPGTVGDECLSGGPFVIKVFEAPGGAGEGIEKIVIGHCANGCKFDATKAVDGIGGNSQNGAVCL
jgi:hypothetical protein